MLHHFQTTVCGGNYFFLCYSMHPVPLIYLKHLYCMSLVMWKSDNQGKEEKHYVALLYIVLHYKCMVLYRGKCT